MRQLSDEQTLFGVRWVFVAYLVAALDISIDQPYPYSRLV